MPYLTAAVILLALLSVGHMLITLGLVRRIRTMASETASTPATPPTLAIGAVPADFAATSDEGRVFDRTALAGDRSLVGFFSVTCEPCKENAPRFAEYANAFGPGRVLAVIQDDDGAQAREFRQRYLPGVDTAVEGTNGPLARAFSVEAFPTMYILDAEGRVETSAFSTTRLPQPAGA
jgi:thiol-disulfide isomerase/thioredoxin